MAPLTLEGNTLGDKHKHYNKLREEAITNQHPLGEFKLTDNDVENMLKIDVACHNKDINFILSVLKCDDMLCVSRALSQCAWLVTDQNYSHIINPEYLNQQLLPHMNTKAFLKLKKYIKHNIKDESLAEQFYSQEKKLNEAVTWLPHCSAQFIENNVNKHADHLNIKTFKRLCEKSAKVFEIIMDNSVYGRKENIQAATFLLKADVDKFLDVLEKTQRYNYPKFNDKITHIIMRHSPKRIIDKLLYFIKYIDIPTFVKYLKAEEIKPFLYKKAKEMETSTLGFSTNSYNTLFRYNQLQYFIKRLPRSEQFDFVKKAFIDKEIVTTIENDLPPDSEEYNMRKLSSVVNTLTPRYVWYRFATFDDAFEEITKLISKDLDNENNHSMLTVLISCADYNLQNIQTILKYYLDVHKNDSNENKLQFATDLLKRSHIHKYNENTWNLLNEIFKKVKLYDESSDTSCNAICMESIIIYNFLNDQTIHFAIQKQFSFSTFKSYIKNLNQEQNDKVFRCLYDYLTNQLNEPITKEEDFTKSIKTMENLLLLLHDWNKQFLDFPYVAEKIKSFIQIRKDNDWKQNLSSLYNFKKSWRKHMFEDSIVLNPCEEVCLNVLKHEPQLLVQNNKELESIRNDHTVSLRRVLVKLRIYWPQSLALQWTKTYINNLNKSDGHKATVRALCTVLPEKKLLKIIDQYKPTESKIDWSKVDDRLLSIQKFLAKNMHTARPQPSPECLLPFVNGDYLQFALPSLNAIFYNLNETKSQIYIPKLLDSRVSLQKHGIRFAVQKLNNEVVKSIFISCWNSSNNASIRAIIFQFTFELLSNEKDLLNAKSLWTLLELFIDNLTFEEDKQIYELLCNVTKIPISIRANYLMKSYTFIEKLILTLKDDDRNHFKMLIATMAQHCREIIDLLNADFIINIIQDFHADFFGSENKFGYVHSSSGIITVISAYLLSTDDENTQMEKYEKIFVPIMKRAFEAWGEKHDGSYIIRTRFQHLLTCLSQDVKDYVIEKKKVVPIKMFTSIQNALTTLPVSENYIMLTVWKLTVAMVKLLEKPKAESTDLDTFLSDLAPKFGEISLEYLKEDVKLYFPSIYKLFTKALARACSAFFPNTGRPVIYECLLSDKNFIQGYLTAIEISHQAFSCDTNKYDGLWEQILSHPSVEVKMHYYNKNIRGRQYVETALLR